MGAVSIDNQLPSGIVYMGIAVMILIAAAVICCIARDISEMRILWIEAEKEQRRKPRNREAEKKRKKGKADLRRRKKHGVNLQETDLRRPDLEGIRHDHYTGIPNDPVQGAGYQDAVPYGTEGQEQFHTVYAVDLHRRNREASCM